VGNFVALIGGVLDFEQVRAVLERDGCKLVRLERSVAEAPLAGAYYVAPARSVEDALSGGAVVTATAVATQPARFVGQGAEAVALRASVERLAVSPHLDVLIKGERGSGRRTVARELHDLTPAGGAWVELVDVADLDAIMASEEPCTVYLGDLLRLSKTQQTKLYRTLSRRRADSRRRFVGALGFDAPTARGNELCHWLVDRFAVTLRVPPLRERTADLPTLTAQILARQAHELQLDCPQLAPDAVEVLRRHGFPGNVRELENVLRTALVACKGTPISAAHLPLEQATDTTPFRLPSHGVNLDALERDVIRQALRRAQGNRTRAASLLGLTRDQVRYRLSKIAENPKE